MWIKPNMPGTPFPPQAFPMRDQHFFTSIDKAMADLDWAPKFGLVDGLKARGAGCWLSLCCCACRVLYCCNHPVVLAW